MHLVSIDDAAWASPWRRRSVPEKLVLSAGLVVTALTAPVWPGALLVAIAASVAIVGAARVPARVLVIAMTPPALFTVLGVASIAVSIGGCEADVVMGQGGPLCVTTAGAISAVAVGAHAIAGALAVMVLATTTPMVDVLTWMHRLKLPAELIEISSLMYRLLFVTADTAATVHAAYVARLGDCPSTRRRHWSNAAAELGSVLLRTWERTTRLAAGLEGRGHEAGLRTLAVTRPPSQRFLLASALLLIVVWTISLLPGWVHR